MKYSIYSLLLVACIQAFSQPSKSPLWCDLEPGKYDVGFKVDFLLDTTRIMPVSDSLPHALKGRPVRMKLYYPGVKNISSFQLTFIEQINVFPSNHQLHTYNGILNARDRRLQGQFSPSSDSLERVLFNMTTMAYENLDHAEGEFPLLIYSLGLDDHQMENSVLWEYLASYGYVVAVLPCFGESLERTDVPATVEGANLLYEDALFVLNTLKNASYVDSNKIGAIGHSFGGIIAAILAARNNSISGVVSLDGSFNNERGLPLLEPLNVSARTMTTPLLNMYVDSPDRILDFSEALASKVYQIAFTNASHYDFQNFGLYAYVTNTSDRRVERRRSAREGKDILMSNILLTRHFFDFIFSESQIGEAYMLGQEGKNKVTSLAKFRSNTE